MTTVSGSRVVDAIGKAYTKRITYKRRVRFVPQLLPRFYRYQQRRDDERKIAKVLLETGATPATAAAGATAPGDRRRLRGIPVVGRATGGGAVPGIDPVAALLRKEARGELGR